MHTGQIKFGGDKNGKSDNNLDDGEDSDTIGDSKDFLFNINYKKKRKVGARIFMDDSSSEEELEFV